MRLNPCTAIAGSLLAAALALAGCKKEKFGVHRIEPAHGPFTGEQEVRIIGSGFDNKVGVNVIFGTRSAGLAEVKDSKTISVVLPSGQVGKVDVTVMFDDNRTQVLPKAFEYTDPTQSQGWQNYGEDGKEKPKPPGAPAPGTK